MELAEKYTAKCARLLQWWRRIYSSKSICYYVFHHFLSNTSLPVLSKFVIKQSSKYKSQQLLKFGSNTELLSPAGYSNSPLLITLPSSFSRSLRLLRLHLPKGRAGFNLGTLNILSSHFHNNALPLTTYPFSSSSSPSFFSSSILLLLLLLLFLLLLFKT
jgi:hypothetical protein